MFTNTKADRHELKRLIKNKLENVCSLMNYMYF